MKNKDFEIRRKRGDKVHALLDGKAPDRVVLLIARAYLFGNLKKPLGKLTDDELLAELFVGPKTLEAIRTVIPSPSSKQRSQPER